MYGERETYIYIYIYLHIYIYISTYIPYSAITSFSALEAAQCGMAVVSYASMLAFYKHIRIPEVCSHSRSELYVRCP